MTGQPVRSMTGAGTFVVETAAGRIEAEARSVNHRFLKTSVRAQGALPAATAAVEEVVRKVLRRGHVSVHLRLRPPPADTGTARIDEQAFTTAARRLKALAAAEGLETVRARDVLAVPGVLGDASSATDEEAVATAMRAAIDGVIQALQAAREREGAALATELSDLLGDIATAGQTLAARAGEVPVAYHGRLRKRLEDLLKGSGVEPDPTQLARECALLAERSDVREEVARLSAHIAHAREVLAEGGAIGRQLEFLVQELHREANTVGSKANDLALSRVVLELKTGIERLREQVQNLE